MTRIVASIEAHMGASHFPGKVLADIAGEPALTRLIRRMRHCRTLDEIVLACSTAPADDALQVWAEREGVPIYRGSEEDVLDRVVRAHQAHQSDVVVEITGHCVLLDPDLIDLGVTTFLNNPCDVVTNLKPVTFPQGEAIKIYRLADLAEVARTIDAPAVRKEVSLYFYEHPERYRILNLFAPARWHAPDYRFQLDHQADREFLEAVYTYLEPAYGDWFGLEEIMRLLRHKPELLDINADCMERSPVSETQIHSVARPQSGQRAA